MELITIIGFLGSFMTVFVGVLLTTGGEGDAILRFINIPSIFITLGGSFMTMLSMHYLENIKVFLFLLRSAFERQQGFNTKQLITTLTSFSEKARREGLLALEDDIDDMNDPFFKKALQLVIDGTDPEIVKQILSDEINATSSRHGDNRKMFEDLADLSPAFGLVGTLIGLVFSLGSIGGDISVLASGMSTALLTTLYGSLLSNAIWSPIASKLALRTNNEVFQKELLLEGVLAIQFGDNPRILQQKLFSYFSAKERIQLDMAK